MKHLGFKTLFLATALSFILFACTETTTPTDNTKPKPNAPKNLVASSIDSSSIKLKWTASDSTASTLFSGYTIEITPGSWQPVNITGNQTTAVITGLTEGTVYTFNIFAKYSNGEESVGSASVSWSPATRFDTTSSGSPIQVYETDSDFPSGLDLYDPLSRTPKAWKTDNGKEWNLGLDTRTSGKVIVASPKMINYNYGTQPGVTEISDNYFEANSLDDVFDSQALSAGNFAERSIDLEALGNIPGVVFILRTKEPGNTEYTYAKVLIKKTDGSWLQGPTGNRYIVCVVSYQKTPGVPYAF